MQTQMDQSWKDWVQLNMSRGCDKDGMIKILLEAGFHPITIVNEMQYLPQTAGLGTLMNQVIERTLPIKKPEPAVYQALDAIQLPLATRVDSDKVHLYLVEDFLSAEECDALAAQIKHSCRPSTITNPDEPDKYFRTSQTCELSNEPNAFTDMIDQRMAEYMGIELERSEGTQGQYYQVGQQFKKHTDYFEPNTWEFEKFASDMGQRTWTFMIYLTDVEEGGETLFTDIEVEVKPKRGRAVVWNNLTATGAVNPYTAHWAKPVIKGEKIIITKWFRTQGLMTTPFKSLPYKQLPLFTPEGFKKTRLPDDLFQTITEFYQQGKANMVLEVNDSIGTYIQTTTERHPAKMIELSDALRQTIFTTICPLLEEWTQLELKPSAIYGIREYQRGATLKMHVDRIDTHQVSMIINVAQQVDQDWFLHIADHKGKIHKVTMQPGDVIFYESARLQHGRPEPLEGEYYANIFAHTAPL
ncbi:prolyl hydroxylase family protein [Thiofilum flexile]|uniref:prolyl hydroxylase family protein n=1 Tax=Thiofilum flexile TaxID=125627 RepID=UPI00037B83B9|nr:2OG-Fe(II) oxygenase [Thiofilum flexile]